jgi:carboxyl-terminal processing protease
VQVIAILIFLILTGALTEENLLFLEAWRAVDRAYYDKSFNGQSWFRYRETALKNEPMNTREETCTVLLLILRIYCFAGS